MNTPLSTLLNCSWATGINRVAVWSFDDMYSEQDRVSECLEWMRIHKSQFPELLLDIKISHSGELGGRWRARNALRVVQYIFDKMEFLVIFLARLSTSTHNTWSTLIRFLGGRSTTAYKAAFNIALVHICLYFKHKSCGITRWATDAANFAAAFHEAVYNCSLTQHCSMLACSQCAAHSRSEY